MTDREIRDSESFDDALRALAAQPASTPAPFAAARVVARLTSPEPRSRRFDLRPWLAAAAFAALGLALYHSNLPSIPPTPVPAPVASGVVVFALDSETTLYFALPGETGGAGKDPS